MAQTALEDLLKSRQCFKLVCGANNEDAAAVYDLVKLYYGAGCRFFDLRADLKVLEAARRAAPEGFFCVSVAAPGDPHCSPVDVSEVLPAFLDVDCIELHAATTSDIGQTWSWLRENFSGLLSLCVSRSRLSDAQMIERVRECGPDIIQADGLAMTGGADNYAATLQAVATAQMLEKLSGYLLLSGGTNTKTAELAHLCGVKAHGVSVGSFARAIKTHEQAKHLIGENLKWLR